MNKVISSNILKAQNFQRAIVVYHKHCNDGTTAAVMARYALSNLSLDDILFVPMGHSRAHTDAFREEGGYDFLDANKDSTTLVLVVDHSLELEMVRDLITDYGVSVVVVDHHKTAEERHLQNPELVETLLKTGNYEFHYEGGYCAAVLVYQLMHNAKAGPYPLSVDQFEKGLQTDSMKWVRLVDDRDLWKNQYQPETNQFMLGFVHKGWGPKEILDRFPSLFSFINNSPSTVEDLVTLGGTIQTVQDRMVADHMEHALPASFKLQGKVYNGYIVNCTARIASDLCNRLMTEDSEADFAISWFYTKSGYKLSMRSREMDTTEVTKLYDGGGHKLASGCNIESSQDFNRLLEYITDINYPVSIEALASGEPGLLTD